VQVSLRQPHRSAARQPAQTHALLALRLQCDPSQRCAQASSPAPTAPAAPPPQAGCAAAWPQARRPRGSWPRRRQRPPWPCARRPPRPSWALPWRRRRWPPCAWREAPRVGASQPACLGRSAAQASAADRSVTDQPPLHRPGFGGWQGALSGSQHSAGLAPRLIIMRCTRLCLGPARAWPPGPAGPGVSAAATAPAAAYRRLPAAPPAGLVGGLHARHIGLHHLGVVHQREGVVLA
jgi:hypothetical protein